MLYRNQTLTKQKVYFQLPNTKLQDGDITGRDSKDLGELFLVQQVDTDYTLTLTFANEADATDSQHPNAAVLVWGVSIIKVDYDCNRIKTRNNKDLKNIFKLVGEAEQWALNPKRGKRCQLFIKMKSGDIESIMPLPHEAETYADITLHLKYHILKDNEGVYFSQVVNGRTAELGEKGGQLCKLNIKLKKQPQSEWLCVDFGTSAVAAAYARDTLDDSNSLIDLKKLKGYLMDITYGKGDLRNDNSDEDEKLISSTVCFHNEEDAIDYNLVDSNPQSFKKYAVWFSPSANDIQLHYLLPCLKTIIGYKHLPNIFTEDHQELFKYRCKDKIIGLLDEEGQKTPLMEVSEVSKIIYRQLFKYYLSNRFDRKNQLIPRTVNKLVLSVPNTYTPLNIQSVKDLARDSMPSIYPEYLHTISESDAVACYYVSRQNEFLSSILDKTKRVKLSKKESVLVFDMGAGTLDLTWFVKEVKRNEQGRISHVDVNILGKLGVSKAGNYIDYELACILWEIYLEKISKNGNRKIASEENKVQFFERAILLDRSSVHGKSADILDRMDLKNYVKELKKILGNPDAEVPRLEIDNNVYIEGEREDSGNARHQPGIRLKVKDILDSPHFKRIIEEMTKDVLEIFGHI